MNPADSSSSGSSFSKDLQNSKSAFERSRFNLVNALMNIEAKKKYEFLESITAMMDAYLRYFKLGYELLSPMEPFLNQVLTYTQHSKEMANVEQDKLARRIQEYRTQTELENIKALSHIKHTAGTNTSLAVGMSSYRNVEANTKSSHGEVQTIKQGYLLKRSSSSRGDWKRRFFVLDSHGALRYYRIKSTKSMQGFQSYHYSVDHNSGVFGRFRSRQNRPASLDEEILSSCTVDLCTSTIKMDDEDMDLRLCFRIISPSKTYTLQAENEADRMDWVNKITGAIASLLNSHFLQQPCPGTKQIVNRIAATGSFDVNSLDSRESLEDDIKSNNDDSVSRILRGIPGNDSCAECSAPEPDWASLNLGILLCIECSGVHRNLGVHISKVRSLTLDVKVWEPTVLDLFQNLGNSFCNSVWEGLLLLEEKRINESSTMIPSVTKPCPSDEIYLKEIYIQAKYAEKALVLREETASGSLSHAANIWQAVKNNNLREVYRLIVMSDRSLINTAFDDVDGVDIHHRNQHDLDAIERKQYDPAACERSKDSKDPGDCLKGCSLLHLACEYGNPLMVELLVQSGADINMCDCHGRTPLHHCISRGNNRLAKLLLRRGARPSIKDGGGLSALERAMELGAITDEELFLLLSECD